jgi:hypothetical protein
VLTNVGINISTEKNFRVIGQAGIKNNHHRRITFSHSVLLLSKARWWSSKLFCCFVDFQQTFGSVIAQVVGWEKPDPTTKASAKTRESYTQCHLDVGLALQGSLGHSREAISVTLGGMRCR